MDVVSRPFLGMDPKDIGTPSQNGGRVPKVLGVPGDSKINDYAKQREKEATAIQPGQAQDLFKVKGNLIDKIG